MNNKYDGVTGPKADRLVSCPQRVRRVPRIVRAYTYIHVLSGHTDVLLLLLLRLLLAAALEHEKPAASAEFSLAKAATNLMYWDY